MADGYYVNNYNYDDWVFVGHLFLPIQTLHPYNSNQLATTWGKKLLKGIGKNDDH